MTTVVVGGGLAGALVARALDLAGREVMVVDANSEPGGIARAVHRDGYLLEPAVGSMLLPHPYLSPLVAGLPVEISEAAAPGRRRFVHHRGRTLEVRPGPSLVTSPLVSPWGKLRVASEPLVPTRGPSGESLEQFMVRRLGREAGRLVAWLMAAGVHAGDPSSLMAGAAFPALEQVQRSHGSLLRGLLAHRGGARPSPHVVTGGTAQLARAVARSLDGRWKSSWPVSHLEQAQKGWRVHGPGVIEARRVIAAVTPEILGRLHPPLVSRLIPTEWSPVAVVWLGLTGPALPQGFGVLIGPDERFSTVGFLFESAYAPDRAPPDRGLVKAIVGGATNPAAVALGDDELVERVTDELTRVLGSTVDPHMSHVVRHRPGIPQYTASRHRMVEELRRGMPPGLAVSGWAYDGVGLSHLAVAATRLASSGSACGVGVGARR